MLPQCGLPAYSTLHGPQALLPLAILLSLIHVNYYAINSKVGLWYSICGCESTNQVNNEKGHACSISQNDFYHPPQF